MATAKGRAGRQKEEVLEAKRVFLFSLSYVLINYRFFFLLYDLPPWHPQPTRTPPSPLSPTTQLRPTTWRSAVAERRFMFLLFCQMRIACWPICFQIYSLSARIAKCSIWAAWRATWGCRQPQAGSYHHRPQTADYLYQIHNINYTH